MLSSICASTVSNVAGIAAGHPLDTLRIRMQMDTRNISMRQCLYETLKQDGAMGVYKGIEQPLIGAIPVCTLVFVVTEATKQKLNETHPQMSSFRSSLLAGAVSGFASLSVFVPVELLKCRAQVTSGAKFSYSSTVSTLLAQQGISGLYRGFWASAWRDVPGWAAYFASYDMLKNVQSDRLNQIEDDEKRRLARIFWTMNAGGVAGVISWIVSIPQDIVKNKQQTHLGEKPLSMAEAYGKITKNGGFASLFKGLRPTLMRGYLVNTITLPLYDSIFDRLNSQ